MLIEFIKQIKYKFMNYLKVIAYSLILLPIWGLSVLDPITVQPFTVFMSFIITALSLDLMRKTVLIQLPKNHRLLIFIGPMVYLILSIVQGTPVYIYHISNPNLWLFIFFTISYFFLHDLFPFQIKKWGLMIGFAYFYLTAVYPYAEIANRIDSHITLENSESKTSQSINDLLKE